MRCRVERRWDRQSVQVWFYRSSGEVGNAMQLMVLGGDQLRWEEVPAGGLMPAPSLELPEEAFEAMVAEGQGILPPSAAIQRHLDDAIKVRDQALTVALGPKGRGA